MVTSAAKPKSQPVKRGHARLAVDFVLGQSAVTSVASSSPIKILAPKSRGPSVWAYSSSFGGGMVGGDQTRIDMKLGSKARCFVGTQSSTKIYRNPSAKRCSHVTHAKVDSHSLLVWAPDPVQAFADSNYTQRQEFYLAPGASLVLLDWFSSGRAARGERWQFSCFKSRNEVFMNGERIFLDSILLDSSAGPVGSPMRGGCFNCFATLLLVGEALQSVSTQILEKIAAVAVAKKSALLVAASPVRDGVVLRLAGQEVEVVGREIHRHLAFLHEFLGDDPWARKW